MRGLLLLLWACAVQAYLHQAALASVRRGGKRAAVVPTNNAIATSWLRLGSVHGRYSPLSMSSTEEEASTSEKKQGKQPKADFSTFAVGQVYDGEIMSIKDFGIFIDISKGHNVLIPRSKISLTNFDSLKSKFEAKSKDKVKIELIDLDAEKLTLSAKLAGSNTGGGSRERKTIDLSKFTVGQTIKGKVVSTHDFGAFVNLEGFDCDGLLPSSKSRGTTMTKDMEVEVKVAQIDTEKNKLVLALANAAAGGATTPMAGVSPERWLQGVVTSVSSFGLFVRPAGMDFTGLVHTSRIPRDLTAALKKRMPIQAAANKTDCEMLFQSGDVVKVRVNGVNAGKTELSMLQFRANEEDEDDYVVEGRDPEDEEGNVKNEQRDDETDDQYDAQDTLLWWQGAPYVKASAASAEVDEEAEVVMESTAVVEGTWRRMFEVDLRDDQADFSTKAREADMKELDEEIGELGGLDEDLIDSDGMGALGAGAREFRMSGTAARLGSHITSASLPSGWNDKIEFFKDVLTAESTKVSALRKGKTAEQSEFEALLRDVEAELEAAAARQPRRPVESEAPAAAAPEAAAPVS